MMDMSLIGKRLDEYHILSQLGEGGMSTIYLGLDTRLQRYTAIKVIHARLQNDPDTIARFKREAQAVARLDHPHIVRLYRYGQVEEILYMAMQYIEGVDLRVVLQNYHEDGELIPPADAVRIVSEICQALDYSHKNGVLHRDVKPSNIMLTRDGRSILTDFGLALMPEVDTQGKAFGTPQYMSPEQAQNPAEVGPASDLYSVGLIIHEMMTGRLPFDEIESPMVMVARRASEPPPPPSLIQPDMHPELERVILKILSLDPAERYQSGAALSTAFEDSLQVIFVEPPPEKEAEIPELGIMPATESPELMESPEVENASLAAAPAAPFLLPYEQISQPRRQRRRLPVPLIALSGCAVLALLAVLLVWGGVQLIRGQLSDRYQAWMPMTASEEGGSAGGSSAEDGGSAGGAYPNPQSEPEPEPDSPPETSAEQNNHVLRIVTRGEDSFFLVNVGQTAVPLAGFRFEDGEHGIDGSEWGIDSIAPGQCVTIWKDRGNPKAPDVSCNEVGNRVEEAPDRAFWKKPFNVIFRNNPITTCSENGCEFFIPVS